MRKIICCAEQNKVPLIRPRVDAFNLLLTLPRAGQLIIIPCSPHQTDQHRLYLTGVNFSSETRTVEKWTVSDLRIYMPALPPKRHKTLCRRGHFS